MLRLASVFLCGKRSIGKRSLNQFNSLNLLCYRIFLSSFFYCAKISLKNVCICCQERFAANSL